MVELFANSGDPDQTPHSVASDLGLHCLEVTCLGVSNLQWVNLAQTSESERYRPILASLWSTQKFSFHHIIFYSNYLDTLTPYH